jgi:hypothetical protein
MPVLCGTHTNKMTSIDWRWFKEGLHDMLLTDTTTPHRLVAWLNIYNGLPYRNEENIVDYWWCISWRTTSYELMHQASLYQMNNPPETTMSRHYAFHHARPQYGRSRSILDRAMNGTPCLTVLSLPWVLYHSRLSSVIKLKWHCFYLHCI